MQEELMELSKEELAARLANVYTTLLRIADLDNNLPLTVPVSRQQLEAMAANMNLAITWSKLTLDKHNISR